MAQPIKEVPDLYGKQPVFIKIAPRPEFPNTDKAYRDALELTRIKAEEARKAQEEQVVAPAPQAAYTAPTVAVGGAKLFIYMHESGNNPGSVNASSGACGLGQALPCSKMPCSMSDYGCQDAFFTQYMLGRYGTWEAAQAFWLAHSWW